MTSSDPNGSAGKALDALFDLLGEKRLSTLIDEPIDLAADTFQSEIGRPLSHERFNDAILEMVHHIFENGTPLRRVLSRQEALSEAVSLLDAHYRGVHTTGYNGAFLDAVIDDVEGIEPVLSHLTETIKAVERRKYVQWVFAQEIGPLDWEDRCRIVSAYLDRYGGFLPDHLRHMDPARMEAHLLDLIDSHLSIENQMNQVFRPEASWSPVRKP